jgi:hypothetical protein
MARHKIVATVHMLQFTERNLMSKSGCKRIKANFFHSSESMREAPVSLAASNAA